MPTVIVPSTEVVIPQKQLLRMHQREEQVQEIEGMKEALPQMKRAEDRGAVGQRIKRLEKSLHDQSPPDTLSGAAKDKIAARMKEIEQKVTQGMLSGEEMRKNPAGSVGQHMKWEKANKKDILEWKNGQIMLDPTSNDPDLANFEKLRPEGARERVRLDAQIPGAMAYTNVPQANWDQTFDPKAKAKSALDQAKAARKAQEAKELADAEAKWEAIQAGIVPIVEG